MVGSRLAFARVRLAAITTLTTKRSEWLDRATARAIPTCCPTCCPPSRVAVSIAPFRRLVVVANRVA
jgi:hypothetical protein